MLSDVSYDIRKLDNAKRGIPSQGAKLTLAYDPMTQNK